MTADSYDPDEALCETPAGDTFTNPDDDSDEDRDMLDDVYDQSGALRAGDYWTGPATDAHDEARDDD